MRLTCPSCQRNEKLRKDNKWMNRVWFNQYFRAILFTYLNTCLTLVGFPKGSLLLVNESLTSKAMLS